MKKDTRTGYSKWSYQDILDVFGEEKVKNRYLFLFDMANRYTRSRYGRFFKADNPIEQYFKVSEKIIGEIILNYFSDIWRLKDFHLIEYVEFQKVAAYTAYWVARCKPIQIIKEIPDEIYEQEKGIYFINETYACNLLITMVYDTTNPIQREYGNLNKFTRALHYHLSYRIYTPQMLELILYALDSTPMYDKLKSSIQD